jgi:hypothetical protein
MNIAFSKIIKINNRLWEFNFRKLTRKDPSYHVDVTNEYGTRILLSLYKSSEGIWLATSNEIPQWIRGAVAIIGETIEKSEKEIMSLKRAESNISSECH